MSGDVHPLVDLHRHLDGNLRLEKVVDLARKHGMRLPADDVEGLRPRSRSGESDLISFIAKVELMTDRRL